MLFTQPQIPIPAGHFQLSLVLSHSTIQSNVLAHIVKTFPVIVQNVRFKITTEMATTVTAMLVMTNVLLLLHHHYQIRLPLH